MNAISQRLNVELWEGRVKFFAGDSVVAYMLGWGEGRKGELRPIFNKFTFSFDGKNWNLTEIPADQVPPYHGGKEILDTLEALKKRQQTLDQELARMGELNKEREQVRQAIWAFEQLIGSSEKTPAADGTPIWQHVQNLLLSRSNEPMTIPEIMEGLAARNVKLEAKNPGESVRTILIRKPDIFERLEGAKFKIK